VVGNGLGHREGLGQEVAGVGGETSPSPLPGSRRRKGQLWWEQS
jgi:hypothetical protein